MSAKTTKIGLPTTRYGFSSNFAKIIAKEDIYVRHSVVARTASFDLKKRVLTMPIWDGISETLYDMVLIHEVGHALDTDAKKYGELYHKICSAFPKISKKVVSSFLNVVEDSRVDRRQKERYPGSISDYAIGYKELYDRDFFGIVRKDVNKLPFIDRVNLYVKNGFHLNLNFTALEKELLSRVESTVTLDDVGSVTIDILKYSQVEGKIPPDIMNGTPKPDEKYQDQDQDQEGSSGNQNQDQDQDQEGSSGDQDQDQDQEGSSDSNQNGQGGQQNSGTTKSVSEILDQVIANAKDLNNLKESQTEKAIAKSFDLAVAKISNSISETIAEISIREPILKNIVVTNKDVLKKFNSLSQRYHEDSEFNEFRDEERGNVAYMVAEFERRKAADLYKKIQVSRTGVLNMSSVYQYKYSDDIFKRLYTTPEGKNHGLIFLLDWSGSMRPSIFNTMKQLLILTMFCRMAGIPFDVYSFNSKIDYSASGATSSMFKPYPLDVYSFNSKIDYSASGATSSMFKPYPLENSSIITTNLVYSGFTLRNILSSSMKASDYMLASKVLYNMAKSSGAGASLDGWGLGGTPLIQAIEALPPIVNGFIKKYSVQVPTVVVFTDGDSDAPSISTYSRVGTYHVSNPNTKNSFNTKDGSAKEILRVMLHHLKDQTKARLVGFWLGTPNTSPYYYDKTKLKDKNYFETGDPAYDKHYFIDVAGMNLTKKSDFWDKFKTEFGDDKKKFTNAVVEFGKSRANSRILLKSFIDDISLDRTS